MKCQEIPSKAYGTFGTRILNKCASKTKYDYYLCILIYKCDCVLYLIDCISSEMWCDCVLCFVGMIISHLKCDEIVCYFSWVDCISSENKM